MEVKVKFNDINVKEEKEKTLVKILMLKGEKGEKGDGDFNVIEDVKVNGTSLPVSNKSVNVPIPTDVSSFNNDSGYLIENDLQMVETTEVEDGSKLTNTTGYSRINKIYGNTTQSDTPTPDNPIDINTVTGDIEIAIIDSDNLISQTFNLSLGNMELCKIREYQDYIYYDNNNWYKYKVIDKIVLDGSESWYTAVTRSTYNKVVRQFLLDNAILNKGNMSDLTKSTYFGSESANNIYANNSKGINCFGINDSGYLRVGLEITTFPSDDSFKTWLSSNNVTLYFILSNPLIEKITDSTLIEQLNQLRNPKLYEQETNFLISGDSLAPKLNITYAITNREFYSKDETDDLISNLENVINKKIYYFNNVSEMKSYNLNNGDMAITKGYYLENDGGSAEYIIVDDNTLTDDGGSVHELNNGLFAKLIDKNGSVNIKQFGAKGDYETDDTEAIQNALNYSKNVYVPKGIFMVQSIYVSDKQTLHGEFPTSRLQCIATNREDGDYMIYINPSSERVNISGLYLGGNGKLSNKRVGCIRGIGDEHWNNSATITDCYITSFSGNAIYLDQNVHSYYLQNLRIVNMISGIYITSTDCNIIQTVIGNVSETGLFLGGDNFVSGVKCWECGKASDLEHKYYGIEMNSNNTVIGYYGQQNHCDDIRINGDGNKIDFTSDMTGFSKTRSDVAIINLGENANYNQIKGLATQGKMHGFFDYLLYFDENQNQVGNTFEIVVYNYYQDFDMVVKNAATVHNSNVIKIDNRDYGCKAENLIDSSTQLYINYANLTDVTSITMNSNKEFVYNYPVNLGTLATNKGCIMVFKMNTFDFTNKTKAFISFDVDSNVETDHGQIWKGYGVKPTTYTSISCASTFKQMKNKWHFDGVIEIPEGGLNAIRIGLLMDTSADPDYTYPDNTIVKISNLDIRVI